MTDTCPSCQHVVLTPLGRPRSPILIVGESPTPLEIKTGSTWSSDSGGVLREELSRAGLSMNYCRATYLWLHAIPKNQPEIKKQCFDFCFGKLLEQMVTARAILVLGAGAVLALTGKQVSHVNGVRVTSQYVSGDTIVIPGYAPGLALSENGVIGDVRFAIEQFAGYAKPILMEYIGGKQ